MLKHMLTSPQQQPGVQGIHHHHHLNGGFNTSQTTRLQLDSSQVMESRNDLNTINGNQQTGTQPNQRYRNTSLNLSTASRQIHQQPLNISTLTSSKHSIGGSSVSPGTQVPKLTNGGLNISRISTTTGGPNASIRHPHHISTQPPPSKYTTTHYPPRPKYLSQQSVAQHQFGGGSGGSSNDNNVGVKEMLVSLGLLCLVSLLLALLSLIFLLKISPVTANDIREILRAEQLTVITAEEYVVVYEVTLALCALTLSLNLCCLLVCAIQFLFAVKLVKSRHGGNARTNKYLQKSSISRVCAVAGFFISIPVFLTGIILYTFIQFHSTPAIVTSAFIGLGIVFCGCAMVHNVFIWQREKTNAVKALAQQLSQERDQAAAARASHNISITNPNLLNASSTNNIMDLGQFNNSGSILMHPPLLNSTHLSGHSHLNMGQYANGMIRPSTTTPPTPTSPQSGIGKLTVAVGGHYGHLREPSGSISPSVPLNSVNMVADKNSVGTSPHELSTLV